MKYSWYGDMVHIKNQCKYTRTRMLFPPVQNFHHDPLTIFPIKYLGIDEHGGNYN